ncbi:MAG TPA: START-like domain-containing protein [Bacteroidia bacterium]|nr:START-like domain-containing protein [Bacteroidia bacterium]
MKVVKKAAPKKVTKPAAPAKNIVKAAKPVKIDKPAKPEKPVKVEKPVKPVSSAKPVKEKKSAKEKDEPDDIGFSDLDEQPVKKKGKGGRKPKSKNDDDEPEIAHDELIEQIIQTTKRQSKAPKKPRILQTFVNPIASLSVALPADGAKKAAAKKEPKGKFELEYVVRTSAGILYELLTTPSGLSEWFADDVNIRDGIFTFFWDGSEQKARLIGFKEDKYVRLQWMDKPEGTYFEFRIERDELTGDISLMIVDFAEESSDQQTSKLLWDSQVNKLLNVLGSN